MNLKHLTSAAVIAAGVVLSAMTSGLGGVNATALHTPPSAPAFHQDPGGPPPGIPAEKCWRYGRSGGGNPRGGGGMPNYLPPCPVGTPAPPS
jgi:hypothetical protein